MTKYKINIIHGNSKIEEIIIRVLLKEIKENCHL